MCKYSVNPGRRPSFGLALPRRSESKDLGYGVLPFQGTGGEVLTYALPQLRGIVARMRGIDRARRTGD